jgi:hypothetical protein
MSDERKQAAAGAGPDAGSGVLHCPWCSAVLPPDTGDACRSCHATLSANGEPNVPGVTALDVEKIALRRSGPPKKSRLMSWISGEVDYEGPRGPVATAGSLAPPPLEVRQEMIRLELEAHLANLTAEAGALAAEEAIQASERGDAGVLADDIRSGPAVARGPSDVAAAEPEDAVSELGAAAEPGAMPTPTTAAEQAIAADGLAPPAGQT